MDVYFRNIYLDRLFQGLSNPGKPKYNENVVKLFRQRIRLLQNLQNTKELKLFRGLNFEALKGQKRGLYSIRIDKKYRLEFKIEKNVIALSEIVFIEDLSNHYK
ncbi:MAG: type II toxin-antitoxin system RelE/ParE family toxin [Chitinophagaceae bacterium]